MSDGRKAFSRFDFNLGRAVTLQLIEAFEQLPIGRLAESEIKDITNEQGVYLLFLANTLMYVGKADSGLQKRLGEHLWNLSGRNNIDVSQLGFKALYIHENWATSTHEDALIQHFRNLGASAWNKTGLGGHDPGRERESTKTKEEHFDAMYPINVEFIPRGISAGSYNANELFRKLKSAIPFLFRYESDDPKRSKLGSSKYNDREITVHANGLSVRELMRTIVNALPNGWQVTFFPGRVILYEERKSYPHATEILVKNSKSKAKT